MSYSDIKIKLKLFISEKQASTNQDYEVFAEIVGAAFGGKGSQNPNEKVYEPKTAGEAVAMFQTMTKKKPVQ